MTTFREVLNECFGGQFAGGDLGDIPILPEKKKVDQALNSIAGIVEAEKKKINPELPTNYQEMLPSEIDGWNACCDHIVRLIKGEE